MLERYDSAAQWHAGQMAIYKRLEALAKEDGREAGLITEMHFKADMHRQAAEALSAPAVAGAPASPPSAWQPIATMTDECVNVILWDGERVTHGWLEMGDEGLRWVIGDEGFVAKRPPTHWRNWPAPPGVDAWRS